MKIIAFMRKSLPAMLAGITLTTTMFVLTGAAFAAEDNKPITLAITDPETRAGIAAIAPEALSDHNLPEATARILDSERMHTLGNWGLACEDVTKNS